MTTADMLTLLAAEGETRCDVFCLPSSIVAFVGSQSLPYDDLRRLESEGFVSIRLEEVPCPPMGDRVPPIRHIALTDKGRQTRG